MAARFNFKVRSDGMLQAAVAAALLVGAPAIAQQPGGVVEPTPVGAVQNPAPRHLVEMARYEAALEAGDSKAAELHAYAAWRAAETALGDDRLTSILAFNFGREVAMSEPTLAAGPLQRAQSLVDAGFEGPHAALLTLYRTYVDSAAPDAKDRDVDPLRDALAAAETIDGARQSDIAQMWLTVAKTNLANDRYAKATEAAQKAETGFVVFAPDDETGLAETFFVRGVASVLKKNRTLDDALTAREYFENGRRLFPPQQSVERFDPALADLVAWNTAADALVGTLGGADAAIAKGNYQPLFESGLNPPEDCRLSWAERTPPEFPANAMAREEFGAVVAVFDLANDVNVHNPRILAAAPSDAFNDAVLKAMRDWRLDIPTINHPACRMNMTTQFSFVLEE